MSRPGLGLAAALVLALSLLVGGKATAVTEGTPSAAPLRAPLGDMGRPFLVDQLGGSSGALVADGRRVLVGVGPRVEALEWQGQDRATAVWSSGILDDLVRDIVVAGPLAFVAAGRSGLVVLHLPPSGDVAELGRLRLPGPAQDVVVAGATAFIAMGPAGIASVDVSDPDGPRLVGQFPAAPGHAVLRLALIKSVIAATVLVRDPDGFGSISLELVDFGDRARPRWITRYTAAGGLQAPIASRGELLLLGSGIELLALDAQDPARPRELSRLPVGAEIRDIAVGDTAAKDDLFLTVERCVGHCAGSIRVDFRDPRAPSVERGLLYDDIFDRRTDEFRSRAGGIAVQDGRLLDVTSDGRLVAVDFDAELEDTVTMIGEVGTSANAMDLASGSAYVLRPGGMDVYDLSDAFVLATTVPSFERQDEVNVGEGFAMVVTSGAGDLFQPGVEIYELDTAGRASLAAEIAVPTPFVSAVAGGQTVVVASLVRDGENLWTRLQRYEVAAAGQPRLQGEATIAGAVRAMALRQELLYAVIQSPEADGAATRLDGLRLDATALTPVSTMALPLRDGTRMHLVASSEWLVLSADAADDSDAAPTPGSALVLALAHCRRAGSAAGRPPSRGGSRDGAGPVGFRALSGRGPGSTALDRSRRHPRRHDRRCPGHPRRLHFRDAGGRRVAAGRRRAAVRCHGGGRALPLCHRPGPDLELLVPAADTATMRGSR